MAGAGGASVARVYRVWRGDLGVQSEVWVDGLSIFFIKIYMSKMFSLSCMILMPLESRKFYAEHQKVLLILLLVLPTGLHMS